MSDYTLCQGCRDVEITWEEYARFGMCARCCTPELQPYFTTRPLMRRYRKACRHYRSSHRGWRNDLRVWLLTEPVIKARINIQNRRFIAGATKGL